MKIYIFSCFLYPMYDGKLILIGHECIVVVYTQGVVAKKKKKKSFSTFINIIGHLSDLLKHFFNPSYIYNIYNCIETNPTPNTRIP